MSPQKQLASEGVFHGVADFAKVLHVPVAAVMPNPMHEIWNWIQREKHGVNVPPNDELTPQVPFRPNVKSNCGLRQMKLEKAMRQALVAGTLKVCPLKLHPEVVASAYPFATKLSTCVTRSNGAIDEEFVDKLAPTRTLQKDKFVAAEQVEDT